MLSLAAFPYVSHPDKLAPFMQLDQGGKIQCVPSSACCPVPT
jgi:hypothetical protein